MGDGSVSLILDVNGLAANGHVLTEQHDCSLSDANVGVIDSQSSQSSWLLVDPGDGSHAAIPLASVERLEEFSADQIETASGHQVVQYRGQIMPLVPLQGGSYFSPAETGLLQVVVFAYGHQCVGIVVGRILDVVDGSGMAGDGGPSGAKTRVISGRVTSLINLEDFVINSMPMLADIFTAA